MPRPKSHRDCVPEKHCGNCKYSHLVSGKLDLLCFKGDKIEIQGQSHYPVDADYILLDGEHVDVMEGDEYSKVWGNRAVESCTEVCDEWEEES